MQQALEYNRACEVHDVDSFAACSGLKSFREAHCRTVFTESLSDVGLLAYMGTLHPLLR